MIPIFLLNLYFYISSTLAPRAVPTSAPPLVLGHLRRHGNIGH